ncbi:MAG: thermonuclease family protein [Sulfurimonas sp.]|nr:thermonuclease family protein [Sulfurimonas sp.]
MAKEPSLATLVNIVSNDILEFTYENKKFSCLAYGVVTIDEIYKKAAKNSTCKKSIEDFYNKRKDLAHYTSSKMKVYQSYPIVFKNDNNCIINIAGEKTLSEFLIEKGLAMKKPLFQDKEYSHYFHNAEKKAKANQEGIWKENIIKECASHIE